MTRFAILLLIVVQLFGYSHLSISHPPLPVCRDPSLQHVYFLDPSASEISGLTNFIADIRTATLRQGPNDGGLVQVICDSVDWERIYRYTVEHAIRVVHEVYCVNKDDFSSYEDLPLRKNKLEKFGPENSLENSNEKRTIRDESSVEDLENNSRVLRAIKRKKVGNKYRQMATTAKVPLRKRVKGVTKRSVERVKRFYVENVKTVSRRAVRNNKKNTTRKNRKYPRPMRKDGEDGDATTPADLIDDVDIERDGDLDDDTSTDPSETKTRHRKRGRGKKGRGRTKVPPKYGKQVDDYEDPDCETPPVGPDLLGELAGYLRHIVGWVRKLKNRSQRM